MLYALLQSRRNPRFTMIVFSVPQIHTQAVRAFSLLVTPPNKPASHPLIFLQLRLRSESKQVVVVSNLSPNVHTLFPFESHHMYLVELGAPFLRDELLQ